MKPVKLFLPGIFLLVLGIGNITVGVLKQNQYKRVIEEIAAEQPALELDRASPIQKIQLAKEIADRTYQRSHLANSRVEFYQLVAIGGKIMLAISVVILLLALGLLIRNSEKTSLDKNRNQTLS